MILAMHRISTPAMGVRHPLYTRVTRTQRLSSLIVKSQKKGFGDASESKETLQIKKSKRGKVASRISKEKQLEKLQAEEREYQKALQDRIAANSSISSASPPTTKETTSTRYEEDTSSSDIAVPEQITDRMLKRIILFSGAPVFFAILLFPLFYYLKKVQDIDIPVWAVYIVQTTAFGGGLLGISYGILSSSWDPQREGSVSGWNEFQANLPLVLDRFRRKD